MVSVICSKCGKNMDSVKKLFYHLWHFHAISVSTKNSSFECGQDGCKRTFTLFRSFKHHLMAYHKELWSKESSEKNDVSCVQPSCPYECPTAPSHILPKASDKTEVMKFNPSASAIRMVANLRSNFSFTGVSLNHVMHETESLLTDTIDHLKEKVTSFLQSKDMMLILLKHSHY